MGNRLHNPDGVTDLGSENDWSSARDTHRRACYLGASHFEIAVEHAPLDRSGNPRHRFSGDRPDETHSAKGEAHRTIAATGADPCAAH